MTEPRFKRGDRVRHRASRETGIVLWYKPEEDSGIAIYQISTGFGREAACPEDVLEVAADPRLPGPISFAELSANTQSPSLPDRIIEATINGKTETHRILKACADGLLGQAPSGISLIRHADAVDKTEFDRLCKLYAQKSP